MLNVDCGFLIAARGCIFSHAGASLPGSVALLAVSLLPAVGDITRFSSGAAFSAYIRCVPRENSTGNGRVPDGEHERLPLRKDGNRYLQSHFYLAAEVARRYDAECANIYVNLMAKGRHHKQAI
ncbi:MAG: IS110 family transposase, partial [Planctomycetota bacterium]|nr:IS110 family transposase [Planctomycetota bacterium]